MQFVVRSLRTTDRKRALPQSLYSKVGLKHHDPPDGHCENGVQEPISPAQEEKSPTTQFQQSAASACIHQASSSAFAASTDPGMGLPTTREKLRSTNLILYSTISWRATQSVCSLILFQNGDFSREMTNFQIHLRVSSTKTAARNYLGVCFSRKHTFFLGLDIFDHIDRIGQIRQTSRSVSLNPNILSTLSAQMVLRTPFFN